MKVRGVFLGPLPSTDKTTLKIKVRKKDKDQESIKSSTTPDTGHQLESDYFTNGHHKREPRG